MQSEPNVDPRQQPVRPTHEEIKAWAARAPSGVARRSAEEKQEWARRYRWRAALGLEETRLAPAEPSKKGSITNRGAAASATDSRRTCIDSF
jgi:hypothetical protein